MNSVALAQIQSSTDKAANLRLAKELIREAKTKGASLIAFPEFLMAFSPASQTAEELCSIAESVAGPFTSALKNAAKQSGINVIATIYETTNTSSTHDVSARLFPDRVYDTAVWIDAAGDLVAVYRKLHLYDAFGFKESDKFAPGAELTAPVESEVGAVGMMICYDLRFPEMARMLTLQGANVLAAPSGWVQGDLKVDHWQTMIRARALENGCYLVAPAQVGNIYIGHSMVADPLGRILVDMDQREGLEIVDLDPNLIFEVREKLPLLRNRRADIYDKR